jgi:hypothetical protein
VSGPAVPMQSPANCPLPLDLDCASFLLPFAACKGQLKTVVRSVWDPAQRNGRDNHHAGGEGRAVYFTLCLERGFVLVTIRTIWSHLHVRAREDASRHVGRRSNQCPGTTAKVYKKPHRLLLFDKKGAQP